VIELSNGHRFEFQCGSGALAFDGRGWWWERPFFWFGIIDPTQFTIVAKTVTSQPCSGRLRWWHPWTCIRFIRGGTVNAVGLTNPGIETWVDKYYPRAKASNINFAASVESDSFEDSFVLGTFLAELDIKFIEVNVSCPNIAKTSTVCAMRQVIAGLHKSAPRHPLVLKLSHKQARDLSLLDFIANNPHIEAVHVINVVPWDVLYPGTISPIESWTGVKGGVSGEPIHQLALQAVYNVKQHTDKPIVGGGGIYSSKAVDNFRHAGASAFSIGTLFLKQPWKPNQIIHQQSSKN
jgi:dihydroorotate dehydrogenase (NAD+) catalytic subunit